MDWGTVATAILGSTVLSTALGALISRFRFDRRAKQLSSWKSEAEIADELEKTVGIDNSDRANMGKIAFALAARAELNRKLATEMVPTDGVLLVLQMVFGVLVIFVGLGMLAMGFGGYISPTWTGIVVAISGACFVLFFTFLLAVLVSATTVRDTLRGAILKVLNDDGEGGSKYIAVLIDDTAATVGETHRPQKTVTVCRKGLWQKLVRNVMGPSIATNVEIFLTKAYNR